MHPPLLWQACERGVDFGRLLALLRARFVYFRPVSFVAADLGFGGGRSLPSNRTTPRYQSFQRVVGVALMTESLQIPPNGGSRGDLRRIVDALLAGRLVALPSETGYLVAGAPVLANSIEQLSALAPAGRLVIYVSEPEAAEDFASPQDWCGPAERLARRCWPGPIVLEFPARGAETALEGLSPQAQPILAARDSVRIGCSGHALLRDVGRELTWPLAAFAASRERPDERFTSAADVAQRCGLQVTLLADTGPPRYQDRATVIRCAAGEWSVVEEGIVGRRTVAQLASEIFLFVCTGNTCRSPMAEGLFRKILSDRLECTEDGLTEKGYVILSAGLATTPGMAASEHSAAVLREEGIDLLGHQSQSATAELLGVADHIVTMTRSHRESILTRYPDLAPRVRLLSAEGRDVSDPFGGDRDDYERCRDEIRSHLQRLVTSLWSP